MQKTRKLFLKLIADRLLRNEIEVVAPDISFRPIDKIRVGSRYIHLIYRFGSSELDYAIKFIARLKRKKTRPAVVKKFRINIREHLGEETTFVDVMVLPNITLLIHEKSYLEDDDEDYCISEDD